MFLVPTPAKLQRAAGAFDLTLHTAIVLPDGACDMQRNAARMLRAEVERFAGAQLQVLSGCPRTGDVALTTDPALAPEAYRLHIAPDGVRITGGAAIGVLWGVQTLRQIVRQCGWSWPALDVSDAPAYPARGFYHDVTRGRTPTLDALKRLADEASFYKLNQLQLYVEHTYLFRDLSEMWRVSRPLTADEIMQLDEYCALRGVELVPSLSCFGHLFELLSTRTYRHLCERSDVLPSTMSHRMHHHTLNISDPRAFELVRSMIDEFMPLFRSRYFNICADETFDLGCDRSREHMQAVGERDYYMGFVQKLCDHVVSRGRTPMFWGDIVARFPEALSRLPQGTVCLNWGYSPQQTEDTTAALAAHGALQYQCPGVIGWNQWMNRLPDSYQNIRLMAQYGQKHGAVGFLNTDWGDFGHINDPRFSLPGMVYGAAFSWGNAPDFDRLNEAISRIAYLDASGRAVGLLAQLQQYTLQPWSAIVRSKDCAQGNLEPGGWDCALYPCTPEQQAAAEQGIDNIIRALCACPMDTSTRPMQRCWRIAAEAVKLWNAAGSAVQRGEQAPDLAARLEHWLYQYESMWREQSHESELWRIRDVTHWYANALRGGG